jgi:hypothetical protein
MAKSSFIDIKGLTKRISQLKEELAHLLHLESYVKGTGKKRGRPAKVSASGEVVNNGKPAAARKTKSKKRGALGGKILKYLATKGKEGAHVKDIANHVGSKPANITAWAYSTGKNKVKRTKPATYAVKE